MKYIKIKDLDVHISDGNYSSKYPNLSEFIKYGIPFIRCNNFENNSITDRDMYYISESKHSELLKGHLKTNDVLVSTRGNIGQIVIVPEKYNDANINAQIVLLRAGSTLDSKYLMWSLKSKYVQMQMRQNQTGSALKQLPIKRLCEIMVPIESNIEEQKNIANKLDNVFELINIKKIQLNKFDELIKSQFIVMFGDILSNKIKYNKYELSEVADIGSSKRIYASEYVEKGVPFYRSKEIIELGHNKKPSVELFITEDKYEEVKEKYGVPKKGDILITAVGTIGETWIVNSNTPFYYKDGNLLLIRLKKHMSEIFFKHSLDILINDFKRKNVSGSSYSALTIEKFKTMKVVYPPIEEQNKFALFVEKVNKQKSEFETSLKKLEELQSSLMQEYFG